MNYELMSELQINYKWIMNGLQSHGWEFMWMNFIHHLIMFNVGVCEIFPFWHIHHNFQSSDLLGMVYEFLWDCFVPYDFTSGFAFLLRYVGTLFMVMFPHLYHVCLWYYDCRNKSTTFNLTQLERWPIGWSFTYLPFILLIHL